MERDKDYMVGLGGASGDLSKTKTQRDPRAVVHKSNWEKNISSHARKMQEYRDHQEKLLKGYQDDSSDEEGNGEGRKQTKQHYKRRDESYNSSNVQYYHESFDRGSSSAYK